jgi:hypothetical protein
MSLKALLFFRSIMMPKAPKMIAIDPRLAAEAASHPRRYFFWRYFQNASMIKSNKAEETCPILGFLIAEGGMEIYQSTNTAQRCLNPVAGRDRGSALYGSRMACDGGGSGHCLLIPRHQTGSPRTFSSVAEITR